MYLQIKTFSSGIYKGKFASPLAFCVSLIRSLRNLMYASSVTLRAPLAVKLVDL